MKAPQIDAHLNFKCDGKKTRDKRFDYQIEQLHDDLFFQTFLLFCGLKIIYGFRIYGNRAIIKFGLTVHKFRALKWCRWRRGEEYC